VFGVEGDQREHEGSSGGDMKSVIRGTVEDSDGSGG